ncbi:MAG: glycine cleavage system protein T [Desulfobulbus propionicus]|nr:MAG: glycine cleavage system protein T [Desulfobulbus propionicus]
MSPRFTPLHDWHQSHGANMAEFGGYSMPLWYKGGAKGEHLAAITGAALFDTSHMALLTVEGKGAYALLQKCFSKDLDRCLVRGGPLVAGRSVYGVLLNTQGFVVDDTIVSLVDDERFLMVVNAAMGATVREHLLSFATADVHIDDYTDQLGKIDLQGPAAGRILAKVLKNPEQVLDKLPYFAFKGDISPGHSSLVELTDSTPIMLSRTGYTGEFGFELFLPAERLVSSWELLLAADPAVLPCGLAARDSLRAGAVLPLSHQDIGDWPFIANPWSFALPWDESGAGFTKEFTGAAALTGAASRQHTLAFAGYDPRKIATGDKSRVTTLDGEDLGRILTCATDMAIDRVDGVITSIATPADAGRPPEFTPRGLCCGFILIDRYLPPGEKVLLTDGKRKLQVEIRTDIRPYRTARKPLHEMLGK